MIYLLWLVGFSSEDNCSWIFILFCARKTSWYLAISHLYTLGKIRSSFGKQQCANWLTLVHAPNRFCTFDIFFYLLDYVTSWSEKKNNESWFGDVSCNFRLQSSNVIRHKVTTVLWLKCLLCSWSLTGVYQFHPSIISERVLQLGCRVCYLYTCAAATVAVVYGLRSTCGILRVTPFTILLSHTIAFICLRVFIFIFPDRNRKKTPCSCHMIQQIELFRFTGN